MHLHSIILPSETSDVTQQMDCKFLELVKQLYYQTRGLLLAIRLHADN